MNLNCLIVDDEPLARQLLTEYVRKVPFLNLVKACSSALEAMEELRNHPVELLFLDIQMPEITGITFLKTLKKKPMVILTTAYSEYALESYEFDVIDYLLKPIVKDGTKLVKIRWTDILYVEGLKDYVTIHTRQQKIVSLQRLKALEETLPQDQFIRIHNSYIIALQAIDTIHKDKVQIGTVFLPISDSYRKSFKEFVDRHNLQ